MWAPGRLGVSDATVPYFGRLFLWPCLRGGSYMSRPSVISFMMTGIIICVAAILAFSFPYTKESLSLIFASLIIMSFLSGKFIFLYAIASAIVFGTFLIIAAFLTNQNEDQQVSFMILHLLVTACLLLNWVLMYFIKWTESENKRLTKKIQL